MQIDHTKADVIVVDEETGEPRGRPWLTLAMDVFNRMVTGFHLAMEAPSRLSISLCLLHAVYDETAWKERGIDAAWPIAGLPEALHADNGADFRSAPSWAPAATRALGGQKDVPVRCSDDLRDPHHQTFLRIRDCQSRATRVRQCDVEPFSNLGGSDLQCLATVSLSFLLCWGWPLRVQCTPRSRAA